ncbi:MAG: hypothetical protein ACLRFI_02555 [Alphaproteobacteria bacterium]
MITKIDLCSMALLKLGEKPIQSWTDNSVSAQLARTLFNPIIDALISSHPWRFSMQEFTIQKNTDGDFIVPSNVLRILKCKGEVIGNKILSDSDTVQILASIRINPEQFPSYFISLAATKLAMEFCIPLTGNQTILRMLLALYESEFQSAKFIDSTTSISNDIGDFSLISARF